MALAGALGGASCVAGAPTGFSAGDRWAIPLVGPLEDGVLLVPVVVGGKGPYLFAIDPDANTLIVDDKIVKEAGLRSGQGPRLDDELDHQNEHFYAEVLELAVGTLTVENKSALIVKTGTYDVDGRAVDGVLGRDVIADSLVFGFDRDAGLVTLETRAAWAKQPVAGTAIHYELLPDQARNIDVAAVSRRTARATIDGEPFTVHLDLGAKASQLRDRSWAKGKLAERAISGEVVDETGIGHPVVHAGKAAQVSLGPLTTSDVVFLPYVENRWPDEDLEGALGLDFFRPYSVWADWDKQMFHVVPRHDPPGGLAARIGRWQIHDFAMCSSPGCVTPSIVDPLAHVPAEQRPAQHPGVVVSFARDPAAHGHALEVLVSATAADGTKLARLVVNLPASADRAMTHLPAEYAGATLTVLDADPFPRACPADGGCVDLLAPPT